MSLVLLLLLVRLAQQAILPWNPMTSCDPQNLWQKRLDSPGLASDLHTGGVTYASPHSHTQTYTCTIMYKHTIINFLKFEEEEVVMGEEEEDGKREAEEEFGEEQKGTALK